MVNPIPGAYSFMVNLFTILPAPVKYFTILAMTISVAIMIVSMIFRG